MEGSERGGTKGGVSRGDKALRHWRRRQDQISPDRSKSGSENSKNGSEFAKFDAEFRKNGAV
jgi:hypothetical protein